MVRRFISIAIVLSLSAAAPAGVEVYRLGHTALALQGATPPGGVPIAGFTPMVLLGLTNATQNQAEWDAMRQPNWTGSPYPQGGATYFTTALFDTGANVNLLGRADRAAFGLGGIGYTFSVTGAGPDVVTTDIMAPAGWFVAGLQHRNTPPSTAAFVGVSNVSSLAARPAPEADLPTVVGSPLALFYSTVIRTDRIHHGVTADGRAFSSPELSFYTSRFDPEIPPFEYRLTASFYDPGGIVLRPPTYIPDIMPEWFPPAPTVGSAFLVDVELQHNPGSGERYGGGQFLFDTGAQVTVISLDQAMTLNLNLASPEFTVEITGIGGTVEEVPGYTLDTLTLPAQGAGNYVLRNVPVLVLNVPDDDNPILGIVGMNLFDERDIVVHGGFGTSTWGTPYIDIGAAHVRGDFNGDGVLSGLDIPGFKQALADPEGWHAANPDIDPNFYGDFNRDGVFSGLDIPGFKQALAGASAAAVPEPATALMLAAAGVALFRRRATR